ncbi:spore protease YyaC [Bacillus massilinigeriensis]|uniref:spore protease YyaC n=1 Tax=Bacillus mediterraneensis TaxID=1805474 RepID=UPI0008F8AD9F|nr:spore protease YyaC [Bacillus mediterraneensis]
MNLKSHFFDKKSPGTKIDHEEEQAEGKIAESLLSCLPAITSRPIVFVCIGTDRSTGDSLGPLVGTLLKDQDISPFHVYGTLDDPIHAVNLSDKLAEIEKKHLNAYIIGIDACLGRMKNVGSITIAAGPVKPGAGVNKELPEVGEAHITGIVNVSGFMEFFVLQNTRLNLVLNMAKAIAGGIVNASKNPPAKASFSTLQWDYKQGQMH